MKLELSLALGWAFLGSAAILKREPQAGQLPFGFDIEAQFTRSTKMMAEIAPNIKPTITMAKPQIRPNAIRKIMRFGPHQIPASKVAYLLGPVKSHRVRH
jgi:hypothetical protein